MFRAVFVLCAFLFAFSAHAITTISDQNFSFTPVVGPAISDVVVSSSASFVDALTYPADQSVTWNICSPQDLCSAGEYDVHVRYRTIDGTIVYNDTLRVKYEPREVPEVVPVDTSPEIFNEPLVIPNPTAIELPPRVSFATLRQILSEPRTERALNTSAQSFAIGTFLGTIVSLLAPTLSGSQIVLIPLRLWNLLLVAFGLRRRMRPWGVVFDSLTKQPLDPALVTLSDASGKEIATSITDIDGRYGFFVDQGEYQIMVQKTNYSFPSNILLGQKYDSVYDNLYHGELIAVGKGAVIAKNLPMDATAHDWNQDEKVRMKRGYTTTFAQFIAQLTNALYLVGMITAITSFIAHQHIINIVMIGVYGVFFIMRNYGFTPRIYGRISIDNTPIAHGVIKIWNSKTGIQVGRAVTDAMGRYYTLVPRKTPCTLSVEIPDGAGGLRPYMSGMLMRARRGILNRRIVLPRT